MPVTRVGTERRSLRLRSLQTQDHPHEFRQASRLHLLHNSRAMGFHRPDAHAQLVRGDFIELSDHKAFEDFLLARRQRFHPFGDLAADFRCRRRNMTPDRRVNRIDQDLVVKGLFNEIRGALFDGLNGHLNVAVTGDENDRQRVVHRFQALLQFQAVEPRHANVADDHAGRGRGQGLEEFRAGPMRTHHESGLREENGQPFANAVVVVNQVNYNRIICRHRRPRQMRVPG